MPFLHPILFHFRSLRGAPGSYSQQSQIRIFSLKNFVNIQKINLPCC